MAVDEETQALFLELRSSLRETQDVLGGILDTISTAPKADEVLGSRLGKLREARWHLNRFDQLFRQSMAPQQGPPPSSSESIDT